MSLNSQTASQIGLDLSYFGEIRIPLCNTFFDLSSVQIRFFLAPIRRKGADSRAVFFPGSQAECLPAFLRNSLC